MWKLCKKTWRKELHNKGRYRVNHQFVLHQFMLCRVQKKPSNFHQVSKTFSWGGWWHSHDPLIPANTNFFHMLPPLPFKRSVFEWFPLINIIFYPPTSRYCAHYEDNIYNPYTESFFFVLEKHKSKEREVNLGSLYGSSWACGIWPLIGIFLIWIDECKNDIICFPAESMSPL